MAKHLFVVSYTGSSAVTIETAEPDGFSSADLSDEDAGEAYLSADFEIEEVRHEPDGCDGCMEDGPDCVCGDPKGDHDADGSCRLEARCECRGFKEGDAS